MEDGNNSKQAGRSLIHDLIDEENFNWRNRKCFRAVIGSSTAEQQGVDNSTPRTSDICSTDTSPEPSQVPNQELSQSGRDSDTQKANISYNSTMFTYTSKGQAIKLPKRLKDYVRCWSNTHTHTHTHTHTNTQTHKHTHTHTYTIDTYCQVK